MAKRSQTVQRHSLRPSRAAAPRDADGRIRRWDAADTHRLNEGHWKKAKGQPINADLSDKLATLRRRIAYELANNGILEGVVETYVTDVVGENGPALQVTSSNTTYAERLERVWTEWSKKPEVTGRMQLPELLSLWIRNKWTCGEYLAVEETRDKPLLGVSYILNSIHPQRLDTPAREMSNRNVVMGVERDRKGKPVRYYIQDDNDLGGYTGRTLKAIPYDAGFVIHQFDTKEDGQARGIPLAACTLQPIGDLRELDDSVLVAARAAADMSVYIFSRHPALTPAENIPDVTMDREPGTETTLPPGWEAQMVQPQQPSTQYVPYREEKQREWGRPVGMPLMMVRLDSSKHNYSSARFDSQIYVRHIRREQAKLQRYALNRFIGHIMAELAKAGELPPEDLVITWIWPRLPHVDPQKEAGAEQTRLGDGTLGPNMAAAGYGLELEAVANDFDAAIKLFEAKNLPIPASWLKQEAVKPGPGEEDPEIADETADDENPKAATKPKPKPATRRRAKPSTAAKPSAVRRRLAVVSA